MSLMNLWFRKHGGNLRQWEDDLSYIYDFSNVPKKLTERRTSERKEALRRVSRIAQFSTSTQLMQLDSNHLLWATVGLYCYFNLRYSRNNRGLLRFMLRRDSERSRRVYNDVIQRILPNSPESKVVDSIISYIIVHKMWPNEPLVVSVLRPLMVGSLGAVVTERLLGLIRSALRKSAEALRHLVRALYELLDHYFWPPLDEVATTAIMRLLRLYRKALCAELEMEIPMRAVLGGPLHKGLAAAVSHTVNHLLNKDLILVIGSMVEWMLDNTLNDIIVMDFGTVLEQAAVMHHTDLYKDTFTHELFDNFLELLSSPRRVVSLLANRVLCHLLDRHDNISAFQTPKIFFRKGNFNMVETKYYSDDKAFLKRHRSRIHDCVMRAILLYAKDRRHLENLYTTLCLLAVEVPCGFTAAALANLIMNIQEAARHNKNFREKEQYHLHAVVMAVMSLLCWLHNASDFYKYINRIINLRAEQAPHLNPPLRIEYSFAPHHVLWDKEELFFDDWEVRYSLWMRFKDIGVLISMESTGPARYPRSSPTERMAAVQTNGDEELLGRTPSWRTPSSASMSAAESDTGYVSPDAD